MTLKNYPQKHVPLPGNAYHPQNRDLTCGNTDTHGAYQTGVLIRVIRTAYQLAYQAFTTSDLRKLKTQEGDTHDTQIWTSTHVKKFHTSRSPPTLDHCTLAAHPRRELTVRNRRAVNRRR